MNMEYRILLMNATNERYIKDGEANVLRASNSLNTYP